MLSLLNLTRYFDHRRKNISRDPSILAPEFPTPCYWQDYDSSMNCEPGGIHSGFGFISLINLFVQIL